MTDQEMQSVAASEIAGGQPLGEALLALITLMHKSCRGLRRSDWNIWYAALGFAEVGAASVYGGSRTVRYLSYALAQAAVAGGSASTE